MIEWKKYDKNNTPPLFNSYLVYSGNHIESAWLDYMGAASSIVMFHKQDGGFIRNVTYYAEINLPE